MNICNKQENLNDIQKYLLGITSMVITINNFILYLCLNKIFFLIYH